MFAEKILQRQPDTSQDQLLKLYWDRANVKRELTSLRRERYALLDQLKEQEGAIVRAQEQLEGLERLLTSPLAAANAMVYFQLRRLWRTCALRVEQFGKELEGQRQRRERTQMQDAELSRRQRRLKAIKERVKDLSEKRSMIADEARRLEDRLARMNAILKLIRARKLRRRIERLESNRGVLDEKIGEFTDLAGKIKGEPLPEPESLSIDSRRLINTALIALAQHLVVHFADDDLATLAKATREQPVADMKFGDREDCDRLVEEIRAQIEDMRRDRNLGDKVKSRAEQLAAQLTYRNDNDSVPTAASVACIALHVGSGTSTASMRPPLEINVLAENYWDVGSLLR